MQVLNSAQKHKHDEHLQVHQYNRQLPSLEIRLTVERDASSSAMLQIGRDALHDRSPLAHVRRRKSLDSILCVVGLVGHIAKQCSAFWLEADWDGHTHLGWIQQSKYFRPL